VQLEVGQDGQQQQSQWTAAARAQWTVAAAMGNKGSAMDSRMAKQLQWAMRRRQLKTIAANAEAAQ
jgi:hypothetical protein